MKKLNYLFLSALAVCLMACQKEANIAPERQTVHMTFGATTEPATKVEIGALSAGKYQMLWSDGDKIKVIATTGAGVISGKGVFDIGSGVASNSATFSGDVVLEEGKTAADLVNFYALYPATLEATFAAADESTISLTNFKDYNVLAVENGVDPSRAAMFSMADGSGKFQFQHGVAYYKLTIGIDDIASVTLKCPTGSERIYGNPTYQFDDGKTTGIGSGSLDNNHITLAPASGTLTKGSTYYFPVVTKYKAFGTLQLVYASSGGAEATIETSKLSSTVPANGNVYDLGCPPVTFSPFIKADDMTINANETEGNITFTVYNPVAGGEVTATATGGSIGDFSLGAVGDGIIPFYCDPNSGDEKKAYVTITYTYNDSETVTKDVVITQKAAGAPTVNTYVLYVNNSNVLIRTLNGEANTTYFNIGSGTSTLDCQNASYFGTATSYTIGGNSYRYARKLDGSNPLSFTVTTGATATLKFYCARREQTKDTSIRVNDGATNVINQSLGWADGQATLYESPLTNLTAGKTYSFVKNGDNIGIFYVEVVETIE